MANNILSHTDHRPWELPQGPWIMSQSWHDLLFAHWPVDQSHLRTLVPKELDLDTFEGEAWVGVVPFRMSQVRPRYCPSVPWLSSFLELNVRTYVKSKVDGRPGVYFFSLDAANPVAVHIARSTFKLPYFSARMTLDHSPDNDTYSYQSHRTHRNAPSADYQARYGPTGPVYRAAKGSLDEWLTERYCLYTVTKGRVYRGEIHHQPWPLQPAFQELETESMAQACHITLPDCDPVLHFSSRIDVVVWPISQVS